jgi:hypothetical protein
MATMLDLTKNKYSSQWRADNAESERELAARGEMSQQMAKGMSVGMEVDFYKPGSGSKADGVVEQKTGSMISIREAGSSQKLHTFKIV